MHEPKKMNTPRHSSLQCAKAKKQNTQNNISMISSKRKLGKLIFSFSTFHFLCPISTNPTPRSLQPHTHQNKTKQPINFYPKSFAP
jgi:hypothetical protein